MRVDPTGIQPPSVRTTGGAAARSADKTGDASAPAADPGSFTPTEELARYLAAARAAPDVRADAVQNAAAKLASGELGTPAAAADAARGMQADGG